jgi:hypothetical protein
VVDSETDFYFKPESIQEIFEEDLKLKAKENEENQSKNTQEISTSNKRKISDANQNRITKYDIVEAKSKYKDAKYLPISQLKGLIRIHKSKLQNENQENLNPNNNLISKRQIRDLPSKNKFSGQTFVTYLKDENFDLPQKKPRTFSENINFNPNFVNKIPSERRGSENI